MFTATAIAARSTRAAAIDPITKAGTASKSDSAERVPGGDGG
jgi:hypothetical protein